MSDTIKQGHVFGIGQFAQQAIEHGDPETPPLASQVAQLERRAELLNSLCGETLACLHVNLQRGSLTTQDDNEMWMLLESWNRQRNTALTP